MSRKSGKPTKTAPIDDRLRKAFDTIQAEPIPGAVTAHLDRLTGRAPRPDRRS